MRHFFLVIKRHESQQIINWGPTANWLKKEFFPSKCWMCVFLPVFFFEFHVEMEPRIFVKVIFLCSRCSKSKIGATSRFLFGQITNEFSCFFSLFLQILLKPFFLKLMTCFRHFFPWNFRSSSKSKKIEPRLLVTHFRFFRSIQNDCLSNIVGTQDGGIKSLSLQ